MRVCVCVCAGQRRWWSAKFPATVSRFRKRTLNPRGRRRPRALRWSRAEILALPGARTKALVRSRRSLCRVARMTQPYYYCWSYARTHARTHIHIQNETRAWRRMRARAWRCVCTAGTLTRAYEPRLGSAESRRQLTYCLAMNSTFPLRQGRATRAVIFNASLI